MDQNRCVFINISLKLFLQPKQLREEEKREKAEELFMIWWPIWF